MSRATRSRSSAARDGLGRAKARSATRGPGLSSPADTVDLGSGRSGRDGSSGKPLVRERQPLRQQPRRLIRRLTVKRHHRGRHAWASAQLRPPSIGDVRDLDQVRPPADGFFESMNGHVLCCPGGEESDDSTLRAGAIKRSGTRRATPRGGGREIVGRRAAKIISSSQVVNRICTCHPQFFHTAGPSGTPFDRRYNANRPECASRSRALSRWHC
jgi:hypothetical protein